jgi:hypothetical protein
MSFINKNGTCNPPSVDKIPESWFLNISDLSKPKIKDYMDESYRKKVLGQMVTGLVNDYKSNGKIVDYTNPQVRKEINEQTAEQQITKAREYAISKSKNI